MRRALVVIASSVFAALPVQAGPPFVTDDPEPTPYGQFEIYLYSSGLETAEGLTTQTPGIEVNYGAAPNLQLTMTVPVSFDRPPGAAYRFGMGPLQLGAKYRFIQEDNDGLQPQVAFFPTVFAPVGSGNTQVLLPVWLQKSFGLWTTFGGGGYELNPGAGNRSFWVCGWALLRRVTDKLSLGGEVFGQTSAMKPSRTNGGFNVAAIYDFNDTYHVVLSAGRGFVDARATNEFSYYIGIELTL